MPRTEEENQRIRDAQRASILEAAKEVFARKGWETTIADIAAAAKISQGLLYHYFANKEAVIGELMRTTLRSDPDAFQKILESEGTPTERLETIISLILKSRNELINTFGITSQMARENNPSGNNQEMMHRMFHSLRDGQTDAKSLHDMMMKRFQSLHDIIVRLIEEGQKSGEFAKDDPSKLALMIVANIQSLTMLATRSPDEYKKHFPYTEIIMRMLKPDNRES